MDEKRRTFELDARDALSADSLRRFAHDAVDWMVDYLIEPGGNGPILSPELTKDVFDLFREELPIEGRSPAAVFEEFREKIVPHATHLQSPGNFAYIPNSTGVVGVVADLLAATMNQNVSLVRGGPTAAAVEAQVVGWIQSLLAYPKSGGGVLTSGGSLANLMGLALARHRAGAGDDLTFYFSEETHSSMDRALRFLGLPPEALRRLPTDDQFRMSPEALEQAVREDRARGKRPAAVVATAGTIGSGAVDPLEELSAVCGRHGLWLHVDGAYGALSAAAESGAWMRAGLALSDSLSIDPHKWLFVPIGTSCLLVRDVDAMRRLFTVVPEYLKVSTSEGEICQPMEHTMELSRRFRALRLWMSLKVYGAGAVRAKIEDHLRWAQLFASWIEAAPGFELSAPVMTSTVCFRYVPSEVESEEALDRLNEELMERMNCEPGLFVSRNRLRGRFTQRLCITHLRTTENDIRRLWEAYQKLAATL